MRAFNVIELLTEEAFRRLEAYEPFTIYYWPIPHIPSTIDDPNPWSPYDDDILGGAITLGYGSPMMLLSPTHVKEMVEAQGYGKGGGGAENNIISLKGRPDLDMSGMISSYRIPMSVPSKYANRILDGNTWTMRVGDVVSAKGIINIAAKGENGQDLFMSWDINVSFAMNENKEVVTIVSDVVKHSMPGWENRPLWYLDAYTQSYYQPDPEDIENGATPIEANFCFTLSTQDSESYNAAAEVTGELLFTHSTFTSQ